MENYVIHGENYVIHVGPVEILRKGLTICNLNEFVQSHF